MKMTELYSSQEGFSNTKNILTRARAPCAQIGHGGQEAA